MVRRQVKKTDETLKLAKECGEILQGAYPQCMTAHELSHELSHELGIHCPPRTLVARLRVMFRKYEPGSDLLPFICERSTDPCGRLTYRWVETSSHNSQNSSDMLGHDESINSDLELPLTPPGTDPLEAMFLSPSKLDIDVELKELDLALAEIDGIFSLR